MDQPPGDDKNWMWVLGRPCRECGYDSQAASRDELGPLIRASAASWRSILSRGDIVAERPPTDPGVGPVWSALEYGAHVHDVYEVFLGRITDMLRNDDPTFHDWDQDAAAIEGRYREQDADSLSYRLAVTAGKLADIVDRVGAKQWDRVGYRSDGAAFTVESLIRYVLHDVTHHVHDADQGFEAIAGTD